jgi:hypothetical protein
MNSGQTKFLAGARRIDPDGSICLEAICRNVLVGFAMLGGGIGSIGFVVSNHPAWLLVGALALPFVVTANRRCVFVFDVPKRVLQISGSSRSKQRVLAFNEIRTFDLASTKPNGPMLLTVNEEALCWVQSTYANRDLKTELAALFSSRARPLARDGSGGFC